MNQEKFSKVRFHENLYLMKIHYTVSLLAMAISIQNNIFVTTRLYSYIVKGY